MAWADDAQRSCRAVRPRGGGIPTYAGNSRRPQRSSSVWGSSPRVRGAAGCLSQRLLCGGTIPAGTGSSTYASSSIWEIEVHPHVHGEQGEGGELVDDYEGSSPRARGAGLQRDRQTGPHGVIPAYAGSSRGRARVRLGRGGHSRMRGGAACRPTVVESERGVIPACARSRPGRAVPRCPGRGHPRMSGEQWPVGVPTADGAGSSPRACGAGALRHVGRVHPRMRREQDGSQDSWSRSGWGHPACARNRDRRFPVAGPTEASPRARGAGGARRTDHGDIGLNPACTGSSRARHRRGPGDRAQPRVHGEQTG